MKILKRKRNTSVHYSTCQRKYWFPLIIHMCSTISSCHTDKHLRREISDAWRGTQWTRPTHPNLAPQAGGRDQGGHSRWWRAAGHKKDVLRPAWWASTNHGPRGGAMVRYPSRSASPVTKRHRKLRQRERERIAYTELETLFLLNLVAWASCPVHT